MLTPPGPYSSFSREERNWVALLYGLLMWPGNMERFAELVRWAPNDIDKVEVAIEWAYRRDLWNYHSRLGDQDALRNDILDTLQPSNRDHLETMSIEEFNAYFGATPQPSKDTIQFPGKWSLRRFDETIVDDGEFFRTCRYKWAHNVKPDLVAMTPTGQVLCVEAKLGSPEGSYPASQADLAVFHRRCLPSLGQMSVQRFLVNDLLGLEGTFVHLTPIHAPSDAVRSITWVQTFVALDSNWAAPWVKRWLEHVP